MSIHPVATAGRWAKSFRGPMTLRRRLVLSIVALGIALSVVIGAVSVIILQSVLLGQLDRQLDSSLTRAVNQVGVPQAVPSGSDPSFNGQAEGTVTVVTVDGTVYNAFRVGGDGNGQSVPAAAQAVLKGVAAGKYQSVNLGSSLGRYRVESYDVAGKLRGTNKSVTVRVAVGLPLNVVSNPVSKLIIGIAIIAFLAIAASIAFALLTVRYALRPLERVTDTASRVADMRLDRGDVALDTRVPDADTDTRTEVGRVGAAMNRMLGHVSQALTARQESENKVRQFVADASHELRTPLASVRGYAELTRRMGKDLPEDVVYAMGRIESESVRMTSLVEELLLLARLDEGTDLVKKDVDLTRIVLDAVHDTGVASSSHQFEVTVPEEPITLIGDPMRLHQVVANLLNNARTHTPEGTEVWVTLERDDAAREAVIRVADNGPGIDPSVMPVLFERFARADSSRSRKAGSTGLGLAIVHAVVNSHGGSVVAGNGEPGAVFTVRLPLEPLPSGTPVALPAPEPVRN